MSTPSYTVWGNPWAPGYDAKYVTRVTFMGHRVAWHKWAVQPLKAVEHGLTVAGFGVGGSYHWDDVQTWNKRMKRGSNTPSFHAWPLALDINPARNPYGSHTTDMTAAFVKVWTSHGFVWGGGWRSPCDPMHMEYQGPPVKTTEEVRDMTPEESEDLRELRHVLGPKQSMVNAITNALLVQNWREAQRLNDLFYQSYPYPASTTGLKPGWAPPA